MLGCKDGFGSFSRRKDALAAGVAVLALSSCSGDAPVAVPGREGQDGVQVVGRVMGGQQPVATSRVSIYLAGTSVGYGQGDTQLVPSTVSDANGMFTFPNVSCPDGDPPVYAVAVGGDAGFGPNANLALSASVPHCSMLNSGFLNVNEVTTVASVWSLTQFLDPSGQHLGAPASNTVGLANAAATTANLADVRTGLAVTALVNGAMGMAPARTVNTLANILALCVNSAGGTACGNLFTAATPPGSAAPSTTLAAAWNIARNPGNHVADLYQTNNNDPFQTPQPLQSAPSDWTLSIDFTDPQIKPVNQLAIDASGNLWIVTLARQLDEIKNNGVPASGSPFSGGGLMTPANSRLTITAGGDIWIGTSTATPNVQAMAVFNGAGQPVPGSPYSPSGSHVGLMTPDAQGNLWVVNPDANGAVDKFAPASGSYTRTGFSLLSSHAPDVLAFDSAGNLWSADHLTTAIEGQTLAGTALPGSPFDSGLIGNGAVLTDANGNVWVMNSSQGRVVHLAPNAGGYSMTVLNVGSVVGTGVAQGALDGSGNLWVLTTPTDLGTVSLAEIGSNGVPVASRAFLDGQLHSSSALAIDGSGNLWIGQQSGDAGLKEVVGVATPVKTPLAGVAARP